MAKASAIARRVHVRLTPVQAYTDYWAVPVKKDFKVPLDEKISFLLKANEAVRQTKGVFRVASNMGFGYEWKYLATSEGSYIEQGDVAGGLRFTAQARVAGTFKSRTFSVPPRTAGYEVIEEGQMLENPTRIAAEAVEHAAAPRVTAGLKDLMLTPAHAI